VKKKIILSLILMCVGIISLGVLNAAAYTYGDLTYKKSGYTITITGCNKSAANVVIPSKIKGRTVTSIDDDAFRGCSGLTSITIPDSVASIGDYAFNGCSSLTSITISDSVTSIGDGAFSGCSSLKSITIPDGVKSSIGSDMFRGCSSLTSITIPDSVTSIGYSAFSGCTGLTSVTIGNGVTSIGGSAFSGCSSLTSVTIPDSVTSISDSAFYGCGSLTSVTIPDSVTSIGDNAFADCKNLAKVTIPDSVTSIGDSAFSGCESLMRITMPDSVTSIGDYAFSGCSSLTGITIPGSVTSIGYSAFGNCSSLNRVNITDIAAWCKIDFWPNYSNPLTYAHNLYLNGKLVENLVIPGGVTSISYYAFSDCTGIKSVTIPDSVTSIGDNAFADCKNLAKVTIPDSVTSIGGYAFGGCTGLTSITIPDSVTSIGGYAFGGCTGLTSVTIPDSVTSIGDGAFRGCTGLTSVTIPDSVTSIGGYTFSGCRRLTSITIPDSVTSIGDYAFDDCKNLNRVDITDIAAWCKINFIKSYDGNVSNPLMYADNLYLNGERVENLVIPDGVTSISDYAFYGCTGLTSVTFPDGLNIIPESAFSNCSNLKAITIPASMEYIRNGAFSGCKNIKYIFFKGSRDFWDNEMLIYTGNDALNNAEIICDAKEKTYNFVTNCEKTLSPVTAYYIAVKPKTDTLSRKKYVTGWYDNPELSGEPVEFPYYSDKTTLYAKLADRTGESFESAVYVPENGSSTINKNIDNKYYGTFIPEKTGEYIFKSTAGKYLYLYNSNKAELASGSNSITFSLAAGEIYYIMNTYMYSYGGTLTVTQAGYKGTSTSISNNGKKIRILPNKIEPGTKITVALYNGDKFVGTKVATYRGGAIEFTTNTEYTSIKVMAWNADNLTPCAKAEVVER